MTSKQKGINITQTSTSNNNPEKISTQTSPNGSNSLGSELYTILIFLGIVLLIVLGICFLYFIIDYMYPQLKQSVIIQGSAGNVQDGHTGHDGYLYSMASNGSTGKDGRKGPDGYRGRSGDEGPDGNLGETGVTGLQGLPGRTGLPGESSNSIVPILNRYDLQQTDSYIFRDFFSWDGENYEVSYYTNIENNSRFILNAGEKIEDTSTDPNGLIPNLVYPTSPGLLDFAGGTFVSNLRIAIGYGRGKADSKDRSDDTIFYLSPPLSRRSYLFRYKFPNGILPDNFKRLNIDYPISRLGNTKEFFFFRSKVETINPLDPTVSVDKYHLIKGLGRYEIVVNTHPQLPNDVRFNYRIIEEFTSDDNIEFNLPNAVFPFNSSNLIYRDPDTLRTITISNRFDLNKVVERNLTFDKVTWKQTDKTVVNISIPEKELLVQYENTYISLEKERQISENQLMEGNYYWNPSKATMENDKVYLELKVEIKKEDFYLKDQAFQLAVRRYIPPIPLNKYHNLEKLYFQFKLSPYGNLFNNISGDLIVTYGENFSFDLIDFKTMYSKTFGLAKYYRFSIEDPIGLAPSYPLAINPPVFPIGIETASGDAVYQLNILEPIIIGYTTYQTKERFVTSVMPQTVPNVIGGNPEISREHYFVNIPLYGYKKE